MEELDVIIIIIIIGLCSGAFYVGSDKKELTITPKYKHTKELVGYECKQIVPFDIDYVRFECETKEECLKLCKESL